LRFLALEVFCPVYPYCYEKCAEIFLNEYFVLWFEFSRFFTTSFIFVVHGLIQSNKEKIPLKTWFFKKHAAPAHRLSVIEREVPEMFTDS